MSPLTRTLRAAAVCASLLALLAACAKHRSSSVFDPDAGHPADWVDKHGTAFRANGSSCIPCHGGDLQGGITKVSCFSDSREGQRCHAAGPGGHPAGWDDPSQHGAAALGSPGFPNCQTCHGNDFAGGAGPSCFPCHGWNAAHGKSGWSNGGSHHRSNQARRWVEICSQCHHRSAGTPGCFNNTLCHGSQD